MSLLVCHLDFQLLALVSVHLMEQCLGDQQFVTLLLYLDDICVFAPTIDDMLDQMHLVIDRLKKFNLKN